MGICNMNRSCQFCERSVNCLLVSFGAYVRSVRLPCMVLTIFGVSALTFMMAMYALERRNTRFVLAFALGCALSSTYGFLSKAWPFGVVEGIWTLLALFRWWHERRTPIQPA